MKRFRGHVLLVEDNPINQLVAREILRTTGLQVCLAGNGEEAVRRVQEAHFDLVLMDIQMPMMDGYEATRRIRTLPGREHLPILAMTAHAAKDDQAECLAAGMNGHVAKPIKPQELFRSLRYWLGNDETPPPSLPADAETIRLPPDARCLDTARGLIRVNQNRALYQKLLLDFVDAHAADVERLAQAQEAGCSEQMRRLAHTLAGLAGNLGAQPLEEAARILEQLIREDADILRLSAARQRVEAELDALSQHIRGTPLRMSEEPPAASYPHPGPSARSRALGLIGELTPLLEEGEVSAERRLPELQACLQHTSAQALLEELQASVDAYEFDHAIGILRKLMAQL